MNGLGWALPLLVCPLCRTPFGTAPAGVIASGEGVLKHESGPCTRTFPIRGGVPRLVPDAPRDRVVEGFDDEWARFATASGPDIERVYAMYFDLVAPTAFAADRVTLDAGCGAGRWAVQVASHGPRVLAVDLGNSVELARRNAAGNDRIACVQADLRTLPVRDGGVDWAYSLGVLHHISAPDVALARITRAVRPGGSVLLYLYYALDNRGPSYRFLFKAVDAVRRVTARLPRPVVAAFADLVAVLVYWPLARLSGGLARAGQSRLADGVPLSFYRDRSLGVMRNDSLDRFGTMIEHRYTRPQVEELMRAAGLAGVQVSDDVPYWHAVGVRV